MINHWMTCDGDSREYALRSPETSPLSRRNLLTAALLSSVWWTKRPATGITELAVSSNGRHDNVLVVVFLRGGADGLNVVVPYLEDSYHRERPTLRIRNPLDLDGFFGFHPAMAALLPHYRDGELAVLHAVGSGDTTRSHFEAMSAMERGLKAEGPGDTSGWIARHLNATRPPAASPLRAVSISSIVPDSLRGATSAVAMTSIAEYRLEPPFDKSLVLRGLERLYEHGRDEISQAGRESLTVLKEIEQLDPAKYSPDSKHPYPQSELGESLKQIAMLIKADVGLEVACVDRGGWDTHVAQGAESGWLAGNLADVSAALSTFAGDLNKEMERVTVVVMTEFGRRVYENTGLGTDHGRASFMLLMGGGVRGGRVYADWPGIDRDNLEGPGDLRVTTDYRSVLSEVLERRLMNTATTEVFKGLSRPRIGVFA